MGAEIGSLEAGKRADIITVDLRRPHLAPANMPVWRLVCFANGQDVDTVIVDGQILMQGRVVKHVDTAEVLAEAEAETRAMLRRAHLEDQVVEKAGWGLVRQA
jgi:cytosine/adenosine deaminase-related metal-dependent hydrolase